MSEIFSCCAVKGLKKYFKITARTWPAQVTLARRLLLFPARAVCTRATCTARRDQYCDRRLALIAKILVYIVRRRGMWIIIVDHCDFARSKKCENLVLRHVANCYVIQRGFIRSQSYETEGELHPNSIMKSDIFFADLREKGNKKKKVHAASNLIVNP